MDAKEHVPQGQKKKSQNTRDQSEESVFLSKMMFFLALSQKERLSLWKTERMCSPVLLSQNS